MSSGSYIQADVICPFYITDSNKPAAVKCEGISEDNKLMLTFRLKEDKVRYMKKFCTLSYKDCYLYKMAYSKYKDL